MAAPEFRAAVIRDALEVLVRLRGAAAAERWWNQVPERLRLNKDLNAFRSAEPTETLSLDTAEELMLLIETTNGDGSGRVLEAINFELVSRSVSRGLVSLHLGSLLASIQRLRVVMERPYVGTTPFFEVSPTESGFSLSVGITGRPRSARLLRYWALGALRACERFAKDTHIHELKLYAETVGDRSNISAYYVQASPPPASFESEPERKRPSRPVRSQSGATLQREVERILGTSTADTLRSLRAPRRPSSASLQAVRTSSPAPAATSGPASDNDDGEDPSSPH